MANKLLLVGALAAGAMVMAGSSKGGGTSRTKDNRLINPEKHFKKLGLSPDQYPYKTQGFDFAAGSSSPLWPIPKTKNRSQYKLSYLDANKKMLGNGARRFMANRSGKYHAGIDLYGNYGDPIIACESGKIVNFYHFFHGAYCLLVQCDSGLVINYGEVDKNSLKQLKLKIGDRVKKGQHIAFVGKMNVSSMLHFETYIPGTTRNERFYGGDPKGSRLLNPTYYLLLAKQRAYKKEGKAFASTCVPGAYNNPRHPVVPTIFPTPVSEAEAMEAPDDKVFEEANSASPPDQYDQAEGP